MNIREKLGYISYVLSGYRAFCDSVLKVPRGFIRPIIYHDIPSESLDIFNQQIQFIKKQYRFISANEFQQMKEGDVPVKSGNILLTFDDGFKSQRLVAEKILNPLGIKAIFFICLGFVESGMKGEQKQFVADNFYRDPESVSNISKEIVPMDWDDLKYLIETGHTIGAHTRKHVRLASVNDVAQLKDEIINVADVLGEKLGVPIDNLAFPFGKVDDISVQALKIAGDRYKYIFSGVRGNNDVGVNSKAIRRDELSLDYSLPYLRLIIEGGLSPYYYFDRKKLDKMAAGLC
jgi:peptidoglycan/xylan/chitin deacetylase (PgdA/CDA1 family)